MAGNVGGEGSAQSYYNQYASSTKTTAADKTESTSVSDPVDTYTPSSASSTSSKGAVDKAAASKLWKDTDRAGEALQKLVQKLLSGSNGQSFWAGKLNDLKLSEADRAEAQSMIDEDGVFGVKQTTERIMGFAKAMVGENASEADIEKMRSAVQKGFDEVSNMFGGYKNLPEVSKKTYESIMKSFDDWKAGGTAEKEA